MTTTELTRPESAVIGTCTVDAATLTNAIRAASVVASKDTARPYLCGVLIEYRAAIAGGGEVRVVATDGHRAIVAYVLCGAVTNPRAYRAAIVGTPAIKPLLAYLGTVQGDVCLAWSLTLNGYGALYLVATDGTWHDTAAGCVDSVYLDYVRALPNEHDLRPGWTCDARALAAVVKRVATPPADYGVDGATYTYDRDPAVALDIFPGRVVISTRHRATGHRVERTARTITKGPRKGVEVVDTKRVRVERDPDPVKHTAEVPCVCDQDGQPTVGVNARYLLDFLRPAGRGRVTIRTNERHGPLSVDCRDGVLRIVMPHRV